MPNFTGRTFVLTVGAVGGSSLVGGDWGYEGVSDETFGGQNNNPKGGLPLLFAHWPVG